MAYADIYNAANDINFQGRCLVAVWMAAQNIMNEDSATPNHKQRADWANGVLQDKVSITPRQIAMQVLRNSTIAANPGASADGDIQFQVNSAITSMIAIG